MRLSSKTVCRVQFLQQSEGLLSPCACEFPGGKLPLSWPRDVGQIPINYAHNLTQDSTAQAKRYWNEPSTPLYPFGYGLSYSTFAFSNLKVAEPDSKTGIVGQVPDAPWLS